MSTGKISTSPGLGDDENVNSTSFLERMDSNGLFHPYDGSTCAVKFSQWAELKSSFLAQSIISDDVIETDLVTFVRNITRQLYTNKGTPQQFVTDFEQFTNTLLTSTQHDQFDSFPVAQSPAYGRNPAAAYNDVLIIFNFIKYIMWAGTKTINNGGLWDPNICHSGAITQYLVVHLFMQPIFNFFGMVRGDRVDKPQALWNQVGITYISHPFLKRTLKQFPDYTILPWIHPGNAQCQMPYWGKWGEKIKVARETNNVWASLMCGISGSTQFILFSYLLAMGTIGSLAPPTDVRNVFTLAVALMTGDGGHNIREVVYGITLSITILHILLNEMKLELQGLYDNTLSLQENIDQELPDIRRGPILEGIYNLINNKIQDLSCNSNPNINNDIPTRNLTLFRELLVMCRNWEPFITEAYNFTRELNIVGISAEDLNAYDPTILTNPQSYTTYKDAAVKYILGIPNTDNTLFTDTTNLTEQMNIEVQVFLALQNNRYTQDNWETGANTKMEEIIRGYPTGDTILRTVNDLTNTQLRDCNQEDLVDRIPFAFPKPKKEKKKRFNK